MFITSHRFVFGSVALAALSLSVLSGCGEARTPVYPVSGKLTFQGAPPVGAQVVLHPVSAPASPSDITPIGVVKEDGTFHITAYDQGDGAPAGEYVATVQWFKIVGDGGGAGRGPNVLPVKYARRETSPLKVIVSEGPVSIAPHELTY